MSEKRGSKRKGVAVTLSDSSYIPLKRVLLITSFMNSTYGKSFTSCLFPVEAVAINGQRISHRSYIVCNGPVIEVDGHNMRLRLSFRRSATRMLSSALELAGGVVDQLVEDHIDVKVEKQKNIVLDPVFAPKP
ncbi:DUF881 domain-containing protein [Bacillus megaterium]|nr:DUF881 domain-containing protein [Priestia megaterium]